jgi:hypothetical protein
MIPAWFDVGVLTVVTVLLGIWVVRRVVRVVRPRGTVGFAVGALVVASVSFLTALGVEVRHHVAQERATAVVRELTGNPSAHAACQRFTPDLLDLSNYAGSVRWESPHVALLRRATCNDLHSWLMSRKTQPTLDQVIALHVVVHEAVHVAGERSESVTECTALQYDARAAELLGATPEQAQALAVRYYEEAYPLMRPEYRSGDCVEDGPLDLSPGDGRFP